MQKFSSLLTKASRSNCLITFHSLGDLDAIASAYAFSRFCKKSKIVIPDHINAEARHFAMHYALTLHSLADVQNEKFDLTVLLDCSSATLAPHLIAKKIDAIIDHHEAHEDELSAPIKIKDANASSVCEMLSSLLPAKKIDEKIAFALAAGIVSDSAHFRSASAKTFKAMHSLLSKCKCSYQELLKECHVPEDISARTTTLQSFQRMQFENAGNYIIAWSITNAFESHAALSLLNIGADFAFVGHAGKKNARISARMDSSLTLPLSMADIMREIAPLIGGTGGGHKYAASASGDNPAKLNEALSACVRLTNKKLLAVKDDGHVQKIEW